MTAYGEAWRLQVAKNPVGTNVIAMGVLELPVDRETRQAIAERFHDALADLVDGFADGKPNEAWLRLATGEGDV